MIDLTKSWPHLPPDFLPNWPETHLGWAEDVAHCYMTKTETDCETGATIGTCMEIPTIEVKSLDDAGCEDMLKDRIAQFILYQIEQNLPVPAPFTLYGGGMLIGDEEPQIINQIREEPDFQAAVQSARSYRLRLLRDNNGQSYATCAHFPGLNVFGNTADDIIQNAYEMIAFRILVAQQKGLHIPSADEPPPPEEYREFVQDVMDFDGIDDIDLDAQYPDEDGEDWDEDDSDNERGWGEHWTPEQG